MKFDEGKGLPLTGKGMNDICNKLAVTEPEIWAVIRVETRGFGFLSDRRPQILFERHVFRKQTNGKHDATHPQISNKDPGGYKGGAAEYDRLAEAISLDEEAALKSASWGLAQIMGFNFNSVGYSNVKEMITDFMDNEDSHLEAMGKFIAAHNKCLLGIQHKDWSSFAACYNGSNFRINQYDLRLAAEYAKANVMLPDIGLRGGQVALTYLGFDPGPIDGFTGRRTRGAISDFQKKHGLPVTGILDEDSENKLHEDAFK